VQPGEAEVEMRAWMVCPLFVLAVAQAARGPGMLAQTPAS
jgi:hypothetical protein